MLVHKQVDVTDVKVATEERWDLLDHIQDLECQVKKTGQTKEE